MRNRLVHGYDQINWSLVWKTATSDVPALLTELEPLTTTLTEATNDSPEGAP